MPGRCSLLDGFNADAAHGAVVAASAEVVSPLRPSHRVCLERAGDRQQRPPRSFQQKQVGESRHCLLCRNCRDGSAKPDEWLRRKQSSPAKKGRPRSLAKSTLIVKSPPAPSRAISLQRRCRGLRGRYANIMAYVRMNVLRFMIQL